MAKREKGSALNPTGQRNANPARFGKLQLRLYALISVLLLTVALIAILEFVNRSLPDGAQTGYAPQLRVRDAPVLAARSSGSTVYFIPASSTVTITSPTCPAVPPSCACPYDSEIPTCSCSPDASATMCTCTVKLSPTCDCDPVSDPNCSCGAEPYVRECVCPPDNKCNSCRCPGGGSYYEPCDCPANPYAAGCIAYPETADCSTNSAACGCSVFQLWTCGYGVTRSDCSVPTTTVGGIQATVATIFPVANTTTTTTSAVSISDPPSSLPITSSGQSSQVPFSRLLPLSNSSQAVDVAAVTAPPTPSAPAVLPSLVSPSPIASPALSSSPAAVSTSSAPPLAAAVPSITSPSPVLVIIASGVATSALAPGVILLVSSTVVPATSGPAPSRVAQVTFLRTVPPASGSVITDTSGTVYTIPAVILAANPSPAVTPASPATLPASAGAATLVAPTASLAPVTSAAAPNPTAPNPTAVSLGGSALTPPPAGGPSPNPAVPGLGASSLVSPPAAGGTISPVNSQSPGSLAGSLAAMVPASSGAVVSANPSAKASGTAASGSLNPSNPPPTAASAVNEATSASAGADGGGGGGGGTSTPSPIPSATSGPVTVAIYSWPVSKTVLGGYIPIILARLFHGGWKTIYGQLNQLATVNQLIAVEGTSSSSLFGPGLSLWYIWPAYVAVWCISPFASELIYFDTNYGCASPDIDNPTNPCWPPIMSVNVWVSRVLQTLLALVAVTVLVLIALWFKKPSGSDGDPTNIAAVAAIMGHPEVERDFLAFDAETSTKEMKEQLKNKKYRLGIYQTETNAERYGMLPASPEPDDAQNADSTKQRGFASSAVSRAKVTFAFVANLNSNWKTFQMRSDIVFTLYLFAIFAIVILYLAHINNMSVIHLFDGSTAGRRLLFAIIACVVSTYWSKLQRDAQTLAPYADLAYPNEAPPQPTILFGKRSLAIVALYPLLRYRHFFAALTAFTAVLSEFFIVALSGMPYRPGQLRNEFLFCGISSLVVLIVMLIMILVVNLWRLFAVPHLPRKPDNIAAVMTYVCNSAMNKDFEGLEQDVKERNRHISELRKRYRYGLRRDADGKERWAVDEVARTGGMEG